MNITDDNELNMDMSKRGQIDAKMSKNDTYVKNVM